MSRNVPHAFLPDGPAFLGAPCPECGKAVAPPEPERGHYTLHEHSDLGDGLLDKLAVDHGNWHLRCAFVASPRVSRKTPRRCPECGAGAIFRPEEASRDARICLKCLEAGAMSEPAVEGEA